MLRTPYGRFPATPLSWHNYSPKVTPIAPRSRHIREPATANDLSPTQPSFGLNVYVMSNGFDFNLIPHAAVIKLASWSFTKTATSDSVYALRWWLAGSFSLGQDRPYSA